MTQSNRGTVDLGHVSGEMLVHGDADLEHCHSWKLVITVDLPIM